MTLAFVFPGQGSQSIGMLASLAAVEPLVQETFAEASEVLGYDLWALCQQGPAELLASTERTQPAMLAAGVATWRAWRRHGGALPEAMAGHSLGEYTALVCSGALDFRTAVALVQFRGWAMQQAVPAGQGAIAAILGLDDAQVEAACAEAAQGEVVQAANFNAPGQVVIAGAKAAVERAIEALKARGAKRAIKLPVSVPVHTALMEPAAQQLAERLRDTDFAASEVRDLYTVDVRRHGDANSIRQSLVEQVVKPVRWTQTIQAILAAGARTIVECGPGKVLTGLNRRIDKNKEIAMLAIEDPESLQQALEMCRSNA
ncbi:malonyl CoA-ACP transacylase [Steroidobacter denitrificans]|uniref:Malonyl CoA-acyl carrier protein transacylase n=1 Tax=Steroidobacter denitrificans TaxID=465721 RepID=A0A127FBL3_STEDE|nr:ACP S-malonyltransferase [Steroidobacter denitrificans]AMN46988.1 malonyl CoA-ACP transacylase [Steroidobacter denitrificans]